MWDLNTFTGAGLSLLNDKIPPYSLHPVFTGLKCCSAHFANKQTTKTAAGVQITSLWKQQISPGGKWRMNWQLTGDGSCGDHVMPDGTEGEEFQTDECKTILFQSC